MRARNSGRLQDQGTRKRLADPGNAESDGGIVSNSHKTSAPAAADITVVNSGPQVKLVPLTKLDDVGSYLVTF